MSAMPPLPKDASKRARRNRDPIPLRVIRAEPSAAPKLPKTLTVWDESVGKRRAVPWPARTREWWQMWVESPLSSGFTQADWDFLLDTALLHARLWRGDTKVAAELRQRVAKFGQTPEDRARLRITFATADEVEERTERRRESSRERRGGLKAAGE